MNPQHKKIAEAIKEETIGIKGSTGEQTTRGIDWELFNEFIEKIIERIADIYEEEDNTHTGLDKPFNKTQFKKTARGEK